MDFIKYTFALVVFAWATLSPELEDTPQTFIPPASVTLDTSFVDMVVTIDSLENTVDKEVYKAKKKIIHNHTTIVKCAHEVDSLYESINK